MKYNSQQDNVQPSNAVLLEKINGIREIVELRFDQNDKDHLAVNEHLKTLNGQVAKNTKFRIKTSVYFATFVIIFSGIVSTIIPKIVEAVFR